MAHFAELKTKVDPTGFTTDIHQIVERVVVVDNNYVPSDEHIDGETWCINFFKGGTWKQTSYNNNFRKMYAGIGTVYDPVKNKFLNPQPFASWVLDSNDDWQSPVTYPNVDQSSYIISWEENNLRWIGIKISDDSNYRWNADDSEWVSL